jgi:hypothetical protein
MDVMGQQSKTKKNVDETPNGAESREKVRADDEAVREAVTSEPETAEKGTKSVLPGPPIPPDVQQKLRETEQKPQRK